MSKSKKSLLQNTITNMFSSTFLFPLDYFHLYSLIKILAYIKHIAKFLCEMIIWILFCHEILPWFLFAFRFVDLKKKSYCFVLEEGGLQCWDRSLGLHEGRASALSYSPGD